MHKEKKIVLVVDDSALIRKRIIPMLEEIHNVQFVTFAGTYEEAIDSIRNTIPDMILLDIQLPDRSGIELLRTIKEKYKDVVVYMITNHANDFYRETCIRLKADYFFDKSKDFDLIPKVIAAHALGYELSINENTKPAI